MYRRELCQQLANKPSPIKIGQLMAVLLVQEAELNQTNETTQYH